ncbi:diguanylate cyclase [Deferribacterales bacterium Es71-Z0220]|uniref:GGDEF domain-containing protein n=1 Tax=Deferrivibrio essentukiensis TaxID=2880922 RepID=UPI001F613595|nr:GGDEF domain-containing protein [Deferrivibrio essentukiensis]MCB4203648.1 diguanylate cyclase [Deferrivibrio essentukiensis]
MEREYSNYFNVLSTKTLVILKQIKDKGEQLTPANIKKYLASDSEIISLTKELNKSSTNFVEDIKKAFNNNSHNIKKYLDFEDIELISKKLEKLNSYNLLNEMSEIIAILGKYYSDYESTLEKIYSFIKEFSQKITNTQNVVKNLKDENLNFIDEDSAKDENILSSVKGLKENIEKNQSIDNLQKQVAELTNSLTEILEQKIYSKKNFKRNLNSTFGEIESDFISYKDKYEELKKEIENYRKQSVTDELTGLYRKNKMLEILSELKNAAIKKSEDFYILMSDIDKFKDVNDTYGHLAGDNVLRHFGKILKNFTNNTVEAFRYGGEEFLITVKGSFEDAFSVASQVKLSMENTKFKLNNDTKTITVSIGIAKYKPKEDIKLTIDRADKNLYMAKAGGRNCIFFESKRVG